MVELLINTSHLKLFASFPTKLSLTINYLMLHYQYCVQCQADKGGGNLSVSPDKGKEKSGVGLGKCLLFPSFFNLVPLHLPPTTTTPKNFFRHLAECKVLFSNLEFSSFG